MAEIADILKERLGNIKNRIAEQMAAQGRTATGKSVSSLNVEIRADGGSITGSKSFLAMEKGRGPGAIPAGFHDTIKQWIVAKGISVEDRSKAGQSISPESALQSFAGAVAYTIMKKGTTLYRQGKTNDIFTTAMQEELQAMANDLAVSVLEKIDTINKTEQ